MLTTTRTIATALNLSPAGTSRGCIARMHAKQPDANATTTEATAMTIEETQPLEQGIQAANADYQGEDQQAYARECADVNVTPSGLTEPPPQKAIMAMVAKQMQAGDQVTAPAMPQAIARLLGTQGGPAPSPALPGAQASPAQQSEITDAMLKQEAAKLLEPYQRLRENAEQFSSTLELVVSTLWKKAKLKKQAKPLVGSSLTI